MPHQLALCPRPAASGSDHRRCGSTGEDSTPTDGLGIAPTTGGYAICEIPGCYARAHGRGLCRIHYDEDRYLETTGQSPEAEAAARRESAIGAELRYGSVSEWQSPYGTGSMFASDEERREAWEARRDELLSDYLTPPLKPGHRPWAWWHYEAGRPEHVVPYPPLGPDREGMTTEEVRDAIDEYEMEPIVFLASRGELSPDELEQIEQTARSVEPRIGTDAEHWGSGGVDYPDRRAVKLWEAVRRAIAE